MEMDDREKKFPRYCPVTGGITGGGVLSGGGLDKGEGPGAAVPVGGVVPGAGAFGFSGVAAGTPAPV